MKFLLFVCLVAAVYCAPAIVAPPDNNDIKSTKSEKPPALEEIPQELTDLLPPELKKFAEDLTEEDMEALKESAKIEDEEKSLAHLKEKSPVLGATVEKLYREVKAKIAKLKNKKAQDFVNELIADAKAMQKKFISGEKFTVEELKEAARQDLKQFTRLPVEAKAELNETFPKMIAFFQSEHFLKLLKED